MIFEDPENLSIDPDRELIKDLNKRLRYDPDTQVPAKFKKVVEKEINLKYEMRRDIIPNFKESWLDCYEIINDLISETFLYPLIMMLA